MRECFNVLGRPRRGDFASRLVPDQTLAFLLETKLRPDVVSGFFSRGKKRAAVVVLRASGFDQKAGSTSFKRVVNRLGGFHSDA